MNTIIINNQVPYIFPKDEYKPLGKLLFENPTYNKNLDCYEYQHYGYNALFINIPDNYTFYLSSYYYDDERELNLSVMFFKQGDTRVELYSEFLKNYTNFDISVYSGKLTNFALEDYNNTDPKIDKTYEVNPLTKTIRQIKFEQIFVTYQSIFNYLGYIDLDPIKHVTEKCIIRVRRSAKNGILIYNNDKICYISSELYEIVYTNDPNRIVYDES